MLRKLRVPLTLSLLALFFYWWLRRYWELEPAPSDSLMGVKPEAKKASSLILQEHKPPTRPAPTPDPQPVPVEPDDLKKIEGIGPKISGVLQAAGIQTFAQLAATDADKLHQILRAAKVRATPTTWPEQAQLAAAADWDGLKALQAELKGGRRS